MNTDPLVSVIVPAFNAGVCLAETLRSAQTQTYRRLEIIVVDAGSADDTYQIARRFAEQDARIVAVRQDSNPGLPATRNVALAHARGELIAFLDADDVWFPTKTAAQLQLLRSDPRANLFFANYWLWDGQRDLGLRYKRRRKFPEGASAKRLFYANLFGTSSVMVKRELFDVAGVFDTELQVAEDWDLWLRAAEAGLWARGVWDPQLRYRLWIGNVTKDTVKTTRHVVRVLEKALARPQPPERLRHYLRSLQIARGNFEFANARAVITTQPQHLPAAAWRAWRHCPRRLKWLLWYLALVWPRSLGGGWSSRMVHRKVSGKW